MGKYIVHEIILLSSLHAFFKMSDSEVVSSVLALFLAIPCIYQAVFAAIPKYGFLFCVWVCSASEPVLSTSYFIREKSCSYVHQKGWKKKVQCKWRGSGLQWDLRASYWDIQTKKMQICLDEVALFWMSQWTACSPAWRILYHVTASCKGPIVNDRFLKSQRPARSV